MKTEAYSEPCQIIKMKLLAKIVNGFQPEAVNYFPKKLYLRCLTGGFLMGLRTTAEHFPRGTLINLFHANTFLIFLFSDVFKRYTIEREDNLKWIK